MWAPLLDSVLAQEMAASWVEMIAFQSVVDWADYWEHQKVGRSSLLQLHLRVDHLGHWREEQ